MKMQLTKPQKLIYDMEKFVGGSISIVCGSMLIQTDKSDDEMKKAVNELYHLNDALRIRVNEEDGQPYQYITEYTEKDIEVLSFNSKEELDNYASEYAKEPLDLNGSLCDLKIVILQNKAGLLAKLHHLISDAWTLALMGTQYNQLLKGEDVKAYSYLDYISSEDEYFSSKRYEKNKEYFLSQFKKCDEVTYLLDKDSNNFNSSRTTFIIKKDETSKIVSYAKSKGVSAFVLFMTVLATYFNKTKMNADKFYIGTAMLNRSGTAERNTVGMFVNTAPVLMELKNESSFAENLLSVKTSAFSVLRNQKYNYGIFLEELRNNHKIDEKLYDVMLSYQNATIIGDEVETTWYHSGMQTESLQIHIDDRDSEGVFRIHYDYLNDKFSNKEIKNLHEHICNLIFNAIEDDDKKLYDIEMLSAEEKHTLMFDFNNTAVDYPKDKCVHQLFEEQVEKTPDKIAVVACDKTLTYKELNEEANRIAHSLITKGFGKGDIVAIKISRKSCLISVILGILKTGAAYLPVDPNYPQNRIDYMISDSKAKLLITDENMQELLQYKNSDNPDILVNSNELFCCIYTSGSTGQPKAVMLNHYNFCNYFSRHIYIDYILECETALCISNVIFDMFINEVFSAILFGLKLVLADETSINTPQKLADLIKKENVQSIICTPTKFSIYLDNKQFKSALTTVKVLTFGGEVLTEELCANISNCTNAAIINGYGPTETTIVSTYGEIM